MTGMDMTIMNGHSDPPIETDTLGEAGCALVSILYADLA